MSILRIPLQPNPQVLQVSLGGSVFTLVLNWRNDPGGQGGWFLDIGDASGTPYVEGIPLVTGVDLLAQYGHFGFQGSLYVQTGSNPDAPPTFDNLGTDGNLYWVTTP